MDYSRQQPDNDDQIFCLRTLIWCVSLRRTVVAELKPFILIFVYGCVTFGRPGRTIKQVKHWVS